MKFSIRVLFLFVVVLFAGKFAEAQTPCVVDDPTNTPLNVRATPNGRVVTKLRNGALVYPIFFASDSQGRDWVKVGTYRRGKLVSLGYVIGEFITC